MAKMRAKVRARALQMSPDQYFQAKQAQTLLWEAINELDKHEPVGRMRNVVPEALKKLTDAATLLYQSGIPSPNPGVRLK